MKHISNQFLSIAVNEHGAELASIKDSAGTEYMWQGDPDIWSGQAPILFPIVGALANGKYHYQGKEHSLPQHGFARHSDFSSCFESENSLGFRLAANEETEKVYPFNFELTAAFTLNSSSLEVEYRVSNNDTKPMPFSIGAHPGFSLKWSETDEVEDYFLEFSEKETADTTRLDENKLLSTRKEPVLRDESVLTLRKDMFDTDALIFSNLNSSSVTLKSRKHSRSLRVDFPGFPDLGIWAKPGAPYVCIEPWYGHVDPADHDGNIENKPGIIIIDPGSDFTCMHRITVTDAKAQ